MGRVINTESAGKDRTRLARATVLAMRELMRQSAPDETTRELAAFIALALFQIHETIDASVEAWEKKGYWVKADRFRMDWAWAGRLGEQMRQAVLAEDWAGVATVVVQTGAKLSSVKLPERHRLGTPWVGAYRMLREMK